MILGVVVARVVGSRSRYEEPRNLGLAKCYRRHMKKQTFHSYVLIREGPLLLSSLFPHDAFLIRTHLFTKYHGEQLRASFWLGTELRKSLIDSSFVVKMRMHPHVDNVSVGILVSRIFESLCVYTCIWWECISSFREGACREHSSMRAGTVTSFLAPVYCHRREGKQPLTRAKQFETDYSVVTQFEGQKNQRFTQLRDFPNTTVSFCSSCQLILITGVFPPTPSMQLHAYLVTIFRFSGKSLLLNWWKQTPHSHNSTFPVTIQNEGRYFFQDPLLFPHRGFDLGMSRDFVDRVLKNVSRSLCSGVGLRFSSPLANHYRSFLPIVSSSGIE
jgi:hypothetical protein